MRCVRICYSKTGRMIYTSHLDVNRMMTRAVRRAELPMWYTEGFNPHPHIAFALPLSLGQSSECEYMDIKIESDMTDGEVLERLAAAMPEGVEIKSAASPVFSINDIGKAEYSVKLTFDSEEKASAFYEKALEKLDSGEIIAEKRGKKGHKKVMKQVNLSDYIFSYGIKCSLRSVEINLLVAAGNEVNLNPSLLAETLEGYAEIKSDMQYIERTGIFTSDGHSFC